MNYFASVLLMIGMAGSRPTGIMHHTGQRCDAAEISLQIKGKYVIWRCIKDEWVIDEDATYAKMLEVESAPKPVARRKATNCSKPGPCTDDPVILGEPPLDVPAIQETRQEEYGNVGWCNSISVDPGGGAWSTSMACDPHAKHKVTRWTCADKQNYALLTSVDGSKHSCHGIP